MCRRHLWCLLGVLLLPCVWTAAVASGPGSGVEQPGSRGLAETARAIGPVAPDWHATTFLRATNSNATATRRELGSQPDGAAGVSGERVLAAVVPTVAAAPQLITVTTAATLQSANAQPSHVAADHPHQLRSQPLPGQRAAKAGAAKAPAAARKGPPKRPPRRMPPHAVYPTCVGQNGNTVNITIGSAQQGTTWQGFGTSLGGVGQYLGALGSRGDRLFQLLFNRTSGMGLTRVRYIIPGGSDPQHFPKSGYFPHSLQPYPGKWQWYADWNQVAATQKALRLGVLHVDSISYSPVWWMTISKSTSGNAGGKPNLDPAHAQDFAAYLARVAKHYRDFFGVSFATMAPFNEALEGWWHLGQRREGNSWDSASAASFVRLLRNALDAAGLRRVTLIGMDSWPDYTVNSLSASVFPQARGSMNAVSVHGYRRVDQMSVAADEQAYAAVRHSAQRAGVPVMQSEWGPLQLGAPNTDTALFMARCIAQHINIMGSSSWYFWQALTEYNGGFWGAIMQVQDPRQPIKPMLTVQFYAIQHYTKWWHEGSKPIVIPRSCQHSVAAVYSPTLHYIAITITNQQTRAFNMSITLSGYNRFKSSVAHWTEVYVTSQRYKYEKLEQFNADSVQKPFTVFMHKRSVTTLAIQNVMPQ